MIDSGGTCFYRKAAVPSIRDWKPTWLTSLFLANGLSRPSVHSIPNLLSWFPWYADDIGRYGCESPARLERVLCGLTSVVVSQGQRVVTDQKDI